MKAAIRDDNPVLFFEHVLLYNLSEELPEGDYTCALDQADVVKEGKDITLLTYSRTVSYTHLTLPTILLV